MSDHNPRVEITEEEVVNPLNPKRTDKRHVLRVDGDPRGAVELHGDFVRFRWYPSGPCQLEESQAWIEGLLELSVAADRLEQKMRIKRGRK